MYERFLILKKEVNYMSFEKYQMKINLVMTAGRVLFL